MSDFVIFLIAFACSVFLTSLVRRYALRRGVVDIPNARSSHDVPTPRGGGLSIVVVFLGAVFLLGVVGKLEARTALAIALGGGTVAAIGFVDDHRHVPAFWRFIVQTIAAVLVLAALGGLPDIQLGNKVVDLGLTGDSLAVLFMVWFTNLFNFMDGIDGIAASEAICIAGGAFLLLLLRGGVDSALLVVLVASSLGFLVWNWPPAKIFMGDVGSAFLGFVLIAVAILTSLEGSVSIWSWLILGGAFIVDATFTLIARIIRRQDWVSAHRSHAYQKASRRFDSHGRVTTGVVFVNVFWLLPLAYVANISSSNGWWLLIVAWFPLIAICAWLGAGRQEAEASA